MQATAAEGWYGSEPSRRGTANISTTISSVIALDRLGEGRLLAGYTEDQATRFPHPGSLLLMLAADRFSDGIGLDAWRIDTAVARDGLDSAVGVIRFTDPDGDLPGIELAIELARDAGGWYARRALR